MADKNLATAYPSPPHYPPASSPSQSFGRQSPMSSSLSPDQFGSNAAYGQQGQSSQSSQTGQGGQDKSPLSLNLGFLKSLTEKRTTRDGNPPKRRGPKPDSKPALTRRQELNRQAQRTHRERKELYIKALEDEVLRLKEVFSNMSQDKDKLADENKQLKQLLAQHGINWGSSTATASPPTSNLDDVMSIGYSGSSTGGYGQAFTPPLTGQSTAPSLSSSGPSQQRSPLAHTHPQSQQQIGYAATTSAPGQQMRQMPQQQQQQQQPRGTDMDQAGIDFVLTLENPCMDHLPWLIERSAESGGEPCGHALMASCPPEPFSELGGDVPFGFLNVRTAAPTHATGTSSTTMLTPVSAGGNPAGGITQHQQNLQSQEPAQKTWELNKADLSTLLDLSKRLNLDGEVTPVMAWGMILSHPRIRDLTSQDFSLLAETLKAKVRCYGFGAVMEEFEVRDAIENVFSTKPDIAHHYKPDQMAMAF